MGGWYGRRVLGRASRGRWVRATLLVAIGLLSAPGVAQAGYVAYYDTAPTSFNYSGFQGEANRVTLSMDASNVKVQEAGGLVLPNLSALSGVLFKCRYGLTETRCPAADQPITLHLGDRNDTMLSVGLGPGVFAVLSVGDDTYRGGIGRDTVEPGAGSDDVSGGDGAQPDTVQWDEPFIAGDRTVSLDNLPNDGLAGEHGNVHSDFEQILIRHPGNHTVIGSAGKEHVITGAGNDWVESRGGGDLVETGGGDDQIDARDGVSTAVHCGDGTDTVTADAAIDPLFDCENVSLP